MQERVIVGVLLGVEMVRAGALDIESGGVQQALFLLVGEGAGCGHERGAAWTVAP